MIRVFRKKIRIRYFFFFSLLEDRKYLIRFSLHLFFLSVPALLLFNDGGGALIRFVERGSPGVVELST